jgi:hypothetical protein
MPNGTVPPAYKTAVEMSAPKYSVVAFLNRS